jgi:hypothetical protein
LRVSFYAMIMVLKWTMPPIYLNFFATRQALWKPKLIYYCKHRAK